MVCRKCSSTRFAARLGACRALARLYYRGSTAGVYRRHAGICCLLSPLFFNAELSLFIVFLFIWGITVIGDSPQFSTLNAENAPREYVGSALTIANSIGFLITVFSIQLVNSLLPVIGPQYIFWLLIPGPVIGLWTMRPLFGNRKSHS